MELQGNIVYLWKKKIIMILEDIYIIVRKTTSESRRYCSVKARSENQHRKHNVVATLSGVATKIQPKPNVDTTSCASWVGF